MKNVIITGANGFIGSSLTNILIEKGINVIAIDISFATQRIPDCDYVKKIEIGLDNVEKLKELIPAGEYDVMYHLAWAGVNGSSKADPIIQLNNIHYGINCVMLCKALGVKKILCAGTIAEQSVHSLSHLRVTNGGMMYGVAKHSAHLMLENYCKNIELPFVWMQFSNIYGVGNKTGNLVSYTLGEILAGKEATFGPANQPYDFIYVDDLLLAIYLLGKNSNSKSSYYIGSGQPRILKEYLFEIGELCGQHDKIKIDIRPDDGIKYKMEMFSIEDIINDIGNYVKTDFNKGVVNTINWLKHL